MVEYNQLEQKQIKKLFELFHKNGIEYVVPRGYRRLPESVPGGDVDVIIKEEDYFEAIETCRQQGFEEVANRRKNIVNLIIRGFSKPRRVVDLLITDPDLLIEEISKATFDRDTTDDQLASEYSEYKAKQGNILIHFANHLAYTSPYNGKKIRADPTVEQKLLDRANKCGQFFVPNKPDELAHLICRGVFDNGGTFPGYYVSWCEELKDEVMSTEKYEIQFEELLRSLFFDAAEIVIKNVNLGTYDRIKQDLISYDNY
jgi:hypothetical protein